MSNNSERLEKLVGFDPVKKLSATGELLKSVVSDIKKEREEKAKTAAREKLVLAFDLREKMHKAEREFESQKAKFEKELGKLLNSLESNLSGSPVPQEEDSE